MELVTAAEAVVTAELPISANAQRKEDDLRQRKGSADGSTLLWHVPAVDPCGAPCWWGGDKRSAATVKGHSHCPLMSPGAGQQPPPSEHTPPAVTTPQTPGGAPC